MMESWKRLSQFNKPERSESKTIASRAAKKNGKQQYMPGPSVALDGLKIPYSGSLTVVDKILFV